MDGGAADRGYSRVGWGWGGEGERARDAWATLTEGLLTNTILVAIDERRRRADPEVQVGGLID